MNGRRVEAPFVDDVVWDLLRRAGERLRCPACDARMIGRSGTKRVRHFAHFRATGCSYGAGESADHVRVKCAVIEIVRAQPGWHADLEVPDAAGSWRADVLAVHESGRRIAFEVQRSGLTSEDAEHRTLRYADDGIETVWLTFKHVVWSGRHPTLVLDAADEARCSVVESVWRLTSERDPRWECCAPRPLQSVLGKVLDLTLRWVPLPNRWTPPPAFKTFDGSGWTTLPESERWAAIEAAKRRGAQAALEREREHALNRDRLVERQNAVRQRVEAALTANYLPYDIGQVGKVTAFGLPVKCGSTLIIIEPVLSRIWNPWHRDQWGPRTMTVALTEEQAVRLRQAIGRSDVRSITTFETNLSDVATARDVDRPANPITPTVTRMPQLHAVDREILRSAIAQFDVPRPAQRIVACQYELRISSPDHTDHMRRWLLDLRDDYEFNVGEVHRTLVAAVQHALNTRADEYLRPIEAS